MSIIIYIDAYACRYIEKVSATWRDCNIERTIYMCWKKREREDETPAKPQCPRCPVTTIWHYITAAQACTAKVR